MNRSRNINIILLSGGSGTRLWPLSNDSRSKQFLKVLRNGQNEPQSMVQRTFEKISNLDIPKSITIATCESQVASIRQQVHGDYATVIEPERRNTAPAIMLACAHLAFEQNADPNDTVVVLPIDAYADQEYYNEIISINEAVSKNAESLVLLGVEPTYPSEKYGYIIPEMDSDAPYRVSRFIEKPAVATARDLILNGALWNCGVFGFKLSYLLDIISRYTESKSFEQIKENYSLLPKNSFDYEIVEKAPAISVIPFSGAWKDLGTWNTLSEEMSDPIAGRVIVDEINSNNVHAINETGLPIVVSGINDAVVVATPDGILVSSKEASPGIKGLIAKAAPTRPMYEKRHWGEYRVLDSGVYPDGNKALTKELVIKKGCQLSYQRHQHRSEVWTVVSGFGEVVVDGVVIDVAAKSVVNIQASQMHSVRAFEDLHIIEVQLGDPLTEDDIERFGYFWDQPTG